MVDYHIVTIAAVILGNCDRPRQCGPDRSACGYCQIHPGVSPCLASEGVAAIPELRGDHGLPICSDRRTETVHTNEGDIGPREPAAAFPAGAAIKDEMIDAVGVCLMVRSDLDSYGMADPLINFSQVFNRNGHHVGFCGLHLIAFFVGGGNRSGSLLIIHETVRKLMDAICIWLFCGEIQSIKNGLDAGIVKAFSIFALAIDLHDHFVQLVKAVPHILDVSPVLRRGAGGNGAAVEAQLHGGHIVL